MNLRFRADVYALRRLVENEHRWLGGKPPTQRDFLLIAARECRNRSEDTRRLDVEAFGITSRDFGLALKIKTGDTRQSIQRGEGNIGAHRHFRNYSVPSSVFGHVCDAGLNRLCRRVDDNGSASD